VQTQDERLPQRAVHDAGLYLQAIGFEIFQSNCTAFETTYDVQRSRWRMWQLVGGGMVILALLVVSVSLYRDLKHH